MSSIEGLLMSIAAKPVKNKDCRKSSEKQVKHKFGCIATNSLPVSEFHNGNDICTINDGVGVAK